MSMRMLVWLVGAVLAGHGDALAVGASAAIGSAGIESSAGDTPDLFSPKPRSAPPVAPAPAAAVAPPAAPATARMSSGNPLWGIPLERLTASRDYPLFARTRRPPPVAAVARPAPAVMAPPPPPPPETEKPDLALLGTISGTESIGLFIESASKSVVRLKAGENHRGWVLRAVRPRQVELAKGLDTAILEVAPPDVKVGPASTLAAPAMMPQPSIAGQALPVNAARAPGAMPTAAAGATIVVAPPTFNAQPAPGNPFSKGRMP
jgi:hypothetical protein